MLITEQKNLKTVPLRKNVNKKLLPLNKVSIELFNEIYTMFESIKESQRALFELAFKKGWYSLEKAEEIYEEVEEIFFMDIEECKYL